MQTFPEKFIVSKKGSVVDIFCGVGGLSHGFLLEGFKVNAGIDVDPVCRYPFERNNKAKFVEWSVDGLTGSMVNRLFAPKEPRILIGCAPCQPFSMYNQKRVDSKWQLLEEFKRIIQETEPDIVSMENVPRLITFQKGQLFKSFKSALKSNGYSVFWDVVNCADYGVPQSRKRLVLLASRVGPIELIQPTHNNKNYKTVLETIGSLPPLEAGQSNKEDPLHLSASLSNKNIARIQASKPGNSWKIWDKALVAQCHKKASGRSYGSVYGRMSWDKPAPTITTQFYGFGNGRFGHPEQDRAISIREGALLQTFPQYYEFVQPGQKIHFKAVGRTIGNAVPVELARAIAISIANTL